MNWLSNLRPPGLKGVFGKRDTPDNLWIKCPRSGELVYRKDLEAAQWVTPSGAHLRIGPAQRFPHLFDDGAFQAIDLPDVPRDPLKFRDDKRYLDRLKDANAKILDRDKATPDTETGQKDCMAAAYGLMNGKPAVVLVQDFAFMGGSLGMAAGEAFITAAHAAIERKAALVVFTASGGARMQEGALSLMQMPRTTLAIGEVREAGLPYIVVLTDPTSGGVSASYAMLGDVHLAEPDAMIAFTGPRVIEQTIREKLPEGFQKSEFLRDKGAIDQVVDRRELASVIGQILAHLLPKDAGTGETLSPVDPPKADIVDDA